MVWFLRKSLRLGPLGALVLLLLGCATIAHADVIELKTGQRAEGTLKQATPASVSIDVGGQTITFEGDKVRAIYFGAPPARVAQQLSTRDDAMKALKALRSVSQGGITYRDYAPRVSDAKIVVDRYLGESRVDGDTPAIALAMDFYVFASSAWNTRITDNYPDIIALGRSPLIAQCEPLKLVIASVPLKPGNTGPNGPAYQAGTIIMFSVPTIWSCAADKLAEAEKLLGGEKR